MLDMENSGSKSRQTLKLHRTLNAACSGFLENFQIQKHPKQVKSPSYPPEKEMVTEGSQLHRHNPLKKCLGWSWEIIDQFDLGGRQDPKDINKR